MNLVADVKRDLAGLRCDPKSLRNFGLLIGAILALIGAWILWHKQNQGLGGSLILVGLLLFTFGAAAPKTLKSVYHVWMGAAIGMGWFVSRALLIFLFYSIVVPIGLLAKAVGKHFLDLPARGERETMWIPRTAKAANYERMY
jgi:uncharacterized membrane protein AbrB (regulator of aidB expression)